MDGRARCAANWHSAGTLIFEIEIFEKRRVRRRRGKGGARVHRAGGDGDGGEGTGHKSSVFAVN